MSGPVFIPASSLSPVELKASFDQLEEAYPVLWAKCYPRRYSEPRCGQYYSPKSVGRKLLLTCLKFLGNLVGPAEEFEFTAGSLLAKYGVPLYFLGKDIATAIMQTTPPVEHLDWANMHLPFEALAIQIPKGTIRHEDGSEPAFISMSRSVGNNIKPSVLLPEVCSGSENTCATFLTDTQPAGFLMHFNLPFNYFPTVNLAKLDQAIQEKGTPEEQREHWSGMPFADTKMTPADDRFLTQCIHLFFGTLMLLETRPEFLLPAVLEKRVPAKKGHPAREYWQPATIGHDYVIRRERHELGGHHASPRGHWVRGHYREQAYGPRFSQHKRLWIEPFFKG